MKKIETMRTLIIILSALALPLAAGAQGEATTKRYKRERQMPRP